VLLLRDVDLASKARDATLQIHRAHTSDHRFSAFMHASPFMASPKNPAQLTVAPQVNFRLRDCCGEAGLTDVNAPLLGTR
jgi:hypothetical protein